MVTDRQEVWTDGRVDGRNDTRTTPKLYPSDFVKVSWRDQEMPHSCMGIRYAKLFEALKSMFKSWNSRAVWTWLILEKALTGARRQGDK